MCLIYVHTSPSEKLQKEAEGGSAEQGKLMEEVKELEGLLPDIDSKVRYTTDRIFCVQMCVQCLKMCYKNLCG